MPHKKKQKAMLEEVLSGLQKSQKTLPSKYFYDERGSVLFDEITELDEYYPTRTERKILAANVEEIGQFMGEKVRLIEPGSGSSDKTRILLNALDSILGYVPIDISGNYLFKVADLLKQEYPRIEITPLQKDYTRALKLPKTKVEARNVVFFPGSTIGNFKQSTIPRFLQVVSEMAGPKGAFLIGVDLKKDEEVLKAAYNDKKGITAAFNKNILHHINRELDADFRLENFRHQAIWNEKHGRIEMHLVSKTPQEIRLNGDVISFKKEETIHTENAHKYTLSEFEEVVAPWFTVKKIWTDEKNWFSMQYLEPKSLQ